MASYAVFHIGLPKTATTFLQHRIFRNAADVFFVHRKTESARVCGGLRRLEKQAQRMDASEMSSLQARLKAQVKEALDAGQHYVLSDENISVSPSGLWVDEGNGPKIVAERLAEVTDVVRSLGVTPRVLIGTREVGSWLASRYAQSAKRQMTSSSQEDFNARLRSIVETKELSPVRTWMDWTVVEAAFDEAFGRENVAFIRQEELEACTETMLSRLSQFIGCNDLGTVYSTLKSDQSENRKSLRPNRLRAKHEESWALPEGRIVLEPSIRDSLHARFGAEPLSRFPG